MSPSASPPQEPQRKRKKRAHFSCAECRRLKLKCDRQVPCSNCTRRRCVDLCPDGTRPVRTDDSAELRQRLEALESLLENSGIRLPDKASHEDQKARSTISPSRSPPSSSARVRTSPRPKPSITRSPEITRTATSSTRDDPIFAPPPLAEMPTVSFDYAQATQPLVAPTATATQTGSNASIHFESPTYAAVGASPEDQSFGTLVLQSGRSKYLGPTAASEWLKDEILETPPGSRPSTPPPEVNPVGSSSAAQFPFGAAIQPVSIDYLLGKLPPFEEAMVFVEAFYRYFSWHWNVVPRDSLYHIFQRLYKEPPPKAGREEWLHQLALAFIVLAHGALLNLELSPNDPIAEEFFSLAKSSLAKGLFLIHNTIPAVQTLHIMAHFCLETEKGRNGDNAWPLWGLAMRIIQAMGLHRDGSRWNLEEDVLEERRRVFWECHAADIFQANCFSRPNSISPDYIDTAFPTPGPEKDFSMLKWELSTIASQVLDHAMKVNAPPYSTVLALHERLINFELSIPFTLKCRTVLLSLPSRYPDAESAILDSPDESRRDLHRTFQQFTLYLNVTESIVFLHRPYFVRALHERVPDPTSSIYGQSYLTIVERCNVIIQIVTRIYHLHPNVTARHWYFWYHAFNAAVCVGTLIMTNPLNPLATFALSQIDATIAVYTAVVQGRASRRMVHNLQWLLKVRQRAADRMVRAAAEEADPGSAGTVPASDESDPDVELLGWRTRLIQRAGKGKGTQTATTISGSPHAPETSPGVTATVANALQAALGDGSQPAPEGDSSAEELMRLFWDPDLVGNVGSFTMGWDWDSNTVVQ